MMNLYNDTKYRLLMFQKKMVIKIIFGKMTTCCSLLLGFIQFNLFFKNVILILVLAGCPQQIKIRHNNSKFDITIQNIS